jgi:hypothetical protein
MFPVKLLPCKSLGKRGIFPNDKHLIIYISNMHMISQHSQYSANSIISDEVVIRVFRCLNIKEKCSFIDARPSLCTCIFQLNIAFTYMYF